MLTTRSDSSHGLGYALPAIFVRTQPFSRVRRDALNIQALDTESIVSIRLKSKYRREALGTAERLFDDTCPKTYFQRLHLCDARRTLHDRWKASIHGKNCRRDVWVAIMCLARVVLDRVSGKTNDQEGYCFPVAMLEDGPSGWYRREQIADTHAKSDCKLGHPSNA